MPAGVEAFVETVNTTTPSVPGARLILLGLTLAINPLLLGDAVAETLTVPVKPESAKLMFEFAGCPAMKLGGEMPVLLIAKSPVTENVTWIECVIVEPLAVTITV